MEIIYMPMKIPDGNAWK